MALIHLHNIGKRSIVAKAWPIVESLGYMNRTDSLISMVSSAKKYKDKSVICGHKLQYVIEHVLRKAVLDMFLKLKNRLPKDPEEMNMYLDDPIKSVASAFEEIPDEAECSYTYDQLLYYEEPDDIKDEIITKHVVLSNHARRCKLPSYGCERPGHSLSISWFLW